MFSVVGVKRLELMNIEVTRAMAAWKAARQLQSTARQAEVRESVRAGLPLEVNLDAVAPFSWLYEYGCDSRLRAAAYAHLESWPNCDLYIDRSQRSTQKQAEGLAAEPVVAERSVVTAVTTVWMELAVDRKQTRQVWRKIAQISGKIGSNKDTTVKFLRRLFIAIFDGTNRLGEALNFLARFVDENFDIIPLLKECHVAAKGLCPVSH